MDLFEARAKPEVLMTYRAVRLAKIMSLSVGGLVDWPVRVHWRGPGLCALQRLRERRYPANRRGLRAFERDYSPRSIFAGSHVFLP